VEQRRGSTSQPLEGAGFDPAFIPGLTAPVSGEPEDARRDEAENDAGAESERPSEASSSPVGEPLAEDAAEPEDEGPVDGPVFEASDRRARIVADHKGVRLSLDDQSCEFRWDEVGAVETETGRFGKRFTVTVHTPDRRWYPIEIEAASRSRFPEWESALDEVLDAYFEDAPQDERDAADTKDSKGAEDTKDSKGAEDTKDSKDTKDAEEATARAE
jgi:hypothetical protein